MLNFFPLEELDQFWSCYMLHLRWYWKRFMMPPHNITISSVPKFSYPTLPWLLAQTPSASYSFRYFYHIGSDGWTSRATHDKTDPMPYLVFLRVMLMSFEYFSLRAHLRVHTVQHGINSDISKKTMSMKYDFSIYCSFLVHIFISDAPTENLTEVLGREFY